MTSGTEKRPDTGLLWRTMTQCGWSVAPLGTLEGGLRVQTAQGVAAAELRLFEAERGLRLLVVDLGPHTLPPQDALYPRYLDFPMETRLIIGAARVAAQADYLLLLTEGRMQLYRLPEELLEYDIVTARGLEDELLPALASKARGKGESASGASNPLEASESLRGWLRHWSLKLSGVLEVAPEDCEKFIWKVVLLLQAARKAGPSEMLGGWGLLLEKTEDEGWFLSYDAVATVADMTRLVDLFESSFMTRIFSGDAEMHANWLAAIEETSLAEQFRAELHMIAASRFEAETVAWLFTRMEREQEGWRREIAGQPPIRKRIAHQGWMLLSPLTADVGRFGIAAALRDLDQLARYWDEFNAYRVRVEEDAGGEAMSQPDLFFRLPRGVNSHQHLVDPINFVFAESLRIAGVAPEEEFGVGLVLMLKALDLVRRLDLQFRGIDALDRVWAHAE